MGYVLIFLIILIMSFDEKDSLITWMNRYHSSLLVSSRFWKRRALTCRGKEIVRGTFVGDYF